MKRDKVPAWNDRDCGCEKPMKKKKKYYMPEDMVDNCGCPMPMDMNMDMDMGMDMNMDMNMDMDMGMDMKMKMKMKPEMKMDMEEHMMEMKSKYCQPEKMCDMPDLCEMPLLLAHAYVPWQKYERAFTPREALAKGTLFPELWGVYPIPR